ncbi:MAG: hypothetical protein N2314_01415 [Brevinematales bacterium]|nr:hypothetical protein [Brevinematales bacterium]
MKRHIFCSLFLSIGIVYSADIHLKSLALGVFLGSPTGISIGYFANNTHVINGVIGWNFGRQASLLITADYTYRWNVAISAGSLFLYAGIGGLVNISDHVDVGLRIPLGLSYFTPQIPLEIFFELGPGMRLVPATDPFLNGGLGIRWRF